jgi:alpha-glucosidase
MLKPITNLVSLLRSSERDTALAAAGYFLKKLRIDAQQGKHHAHGDFQNMGHLSGYDKHERGITITSSYGAIRLTVIAADCIQVRFQASGKFAVPFSYAVAKVTWAAVPFTVTETDQYIVLSTAELTCQIDRTTCALIFKDQQGHMISRETQSVSWREGEFRLTRELPTDEACYGLAEQPTALDLRGRRYEIWNTDPISYERNKPPIYFTIPFYLGVTKDYVFGLFWDNPAKGYVDIGAETPNQIVFGGIVGELRYYVFSGTDINAVLGRYSELTGRMPMPPIWALGFHISRWSYYPADTVRDIANEFRKRKIPCDVIYFDVHYMDGYRVFTWDRERFPAPALLLGELSDMGYKPVVILDPGVKVDSNYDVYKSGLSENIFVKTPSGKVFTAPVWAGNSAFPDFTSPKTRAWWAAQIASLVKAGVVGLWNDMNEPVAFNLNSDKELPESVRHDFEGVGASHLEAHNLYGTLMGRASREGLERARPGKRPFNIIRAAHAGAQRYASSWTGDNHSTWDHLHLNVSMVINSGLSGLAFTGADVGGFGGACEPELYARWIQLGALMPYFRVHTAIGTPQQEPWQYGAEVEAIARKYIELRYQLLPYFYTLFAQNSQYGWPIVRPLFTADPTDDRLRRIEDTFMLGDSLLAAPVLEKGQREREIVLPRGRWFDYLTHQAYEGGQTIKVLAPLETLPLFVRAGKVIPLWPLQQFVGQVPIKELNLKVFVGDGDSTLYEDAGESLDYTSGVYRWLYFTCKLAQGNMTLDWRQAGRYIPPYTAVRCEIFGIQFEPVTVELDNKPAPLWYYEKNIVEFTAPKPFEHAKITAR